MFKVLWGIYPFVVTFVVMVTANHFWLDAALGALVAALSALRRLRRVRACPPGGLGVAHRQSMSIRTGAEMRELRARTA